MILKETWPGPGYGLRGLLEKVEVFLWKNEHFVFLHGAGNRLNGGAAAKVSEKPWLGSRIRVWPKKAYLRKCSFPIGKVMISCCCKVRRNFSTVEQL